MPLPTARLRGVDVRYISLCGQPKNGRSLILKSDLAEGESVVERTVPLVKSDPVRRMAYGVVYAPESVDTDGHVMGADDIEAAMLAFMAKGRVGSVDTDHDEQTGGAFVAECWLVKGTPSGETCDALFPDEPPGTWCIGVKVEDDVTWDRVAKGELAGLSLAGVAVVEPIEVETSEGDGVAKAEPSAETVAEAEPVEAEPSPLSEAEAETLLALVEKALSASTGSRSGGGGTATAGDRAASDAVSLKEKPMRATVVCRTADPETGEEGAPTLTLESVRAVVADAVAPLVARLGVVEKATPGRQSVTADDVAPAARPRGLKIL